MISYHLRLWRGSVLGSVLIALLHSLRFAAWAQTDPPVNDRVQDILILPAKAGAATADDLYSLANLQGVTGVHGVAVRGPDFLQGADFKALLNRYLGQPLSF